MSNVPTALSTCSYPKAHTSQPSSWLETKPQTLSLRSALTVALCIGGLTVHSDTWLTPPMNSDSVVGHDGYPVISTVHQLWGYGLVPKLFLQV